MSPSSTVRVTQRYHGTAREHSAPRLPPYYRIRHIVRHVGLGLPFLVGSRAWFRLLAWKRPMPSWGVWRDIQREFFELLETDLDNCVDGYYPYELLSEIPWWPYVCQVFDNVHEMGRMIRRRQQGRHDELPSDIDRSSYPDYYLRTFHWQSDGWFSEASAKRYDAGVEFIFLCTADVMRRMLIPPLAESTGAGGRVLDVGCGTGRLLYQTHVALPQMELYGVDMSPHYLEYARKLYSSSSLPVTWAMSNAEKLAFQSEQFDAVVSSFMFHELPKDARRRVAAELYRVVKPGGTVAICDSAQTHDASPGLRFLQRDFPVLMHEPYYKSYLGDPLEGLLGDVGLKLRSSNTHFFSKVVVAQKPKSSRFRTLPTANKQHHTS